MWNRWHSRLQLAHFDPSFILFPSCLGVICQVTTCFNEQDEQMWQNITVGSLKIFEGEQFWGFAAFEGRKGFGTGSTSSREVDDSPPDCCVENLRRMPLMIQSSWSLALGTATWFELPEVGIAMLPLLENAMTFLSHNPWPCRNHYHVVLLPQGWGFDVMKKAKCLWRDGLVIPCVYTPKNQSHRHTSWLRRLRQRTAPGQITMLVVWGWEVNYQLKDLY